MIIGLTGGIGSGKTTVANFFAAFNNVAIYIADVEAKILMNSSKIIKEKLVKEFGVQSYIDETLNRKFIADIVFNDAAKLATLNAIVHPEVKKHFKNFVENNKDKAYIIYENAILFESKSNLFCDFIITVYAAISIKMKRVTLRDAVSEKEVLSRMNTQWNDEKKMLQSNYIICNESMNDTKNQVNSIHNILTDKVRYF